METWIQIGTSPLQSFTYPLLPPLPRSALPPSRPPPFLPSSLPSDLPEGVLQATIDGLQAEQPHRREHQPEVAAKVTRWREGRKEGGRQEDIGRRVHSEQSNHSDGGLMHAPCPPSSLQTIIPKVDEYILRLALTMAGDESTLPFTFILDDPAGNSYVENPKAPSLDPRLRVTFYDRTATQVGREGGREGVTACAGASRSPIPLSLPLPPSGHGNRLATHTGVKSRGQG